MQCASEPMNKGKMPQRSDILRLFTQILVASAASACSLMPVSGPMGSAVVDPDSAKANTYVVVDLTPSILQKLQGMAPKSLASSFGDLQEVPSLTLGIGDAVSVSIWEAGSGGLFFNSSVIAPAPAQSGTGVPTSVSAAPSSATGARFVTLPTQVVDHLGNITVPYAGQIRIAGLSPVEAQQRIEHALGKNALQPQVMVSLVQNQSNLVTVSGDVAQPGRLPLYLQGNRLLDVIAQAGGSKWPAYDTTVQLVREGVSRRVRLGEVVANPADNIQMQSGDLLHLIRDPQTVAVLGATTNNNALGPSPGNALVSFDTEHLTLAEALAKAGGLRDSQADAKAVFVFRFEPVEVVRALVPGTSGMELPAVTPVVYHANLQQPSALFLSQSFPMHDKDLIYVADTESVQLSKLIQIADNTAVILSPVYFFTPH